MEKKIYSAKIVHRFRLIDEMSVEKYNLPMRTMHWISGIGFLFTMFLGIILSNTTWLKGATYFNTPLHKSFGVLIFVLVVMRVIVRTYSSLPGYVEVPSRFSRLELYLAKFTYFSLYFLMLEIPLIGYLMSNSAGRAISFFGLFELPPLIAVNKDITKSLYSIHQWSGYAALFFVGLHLLGSMKHLIFDRMNILKRIT